MWARNAFHPTVRGRRRALIADRFGRSHSQSFFENINFEKLNRPLPVNRRLLTEFRVGQSQIDPSRRGRGTIEMSRGSLLLRTGGANNINYYPLSDTSLFSRRGFDPFSSVDRKRLIFVVRLTSQIGLWKLTHLTIRFVRLKRTTRPRPVSGRRRSFILVHAGGCGVGGKTMAIIRSRKKNLKYCWPLIVQSMTNSHGITNYT